MTRDHLLGWHHRAQLIADSMPASFNPNAPRLVRVPLPESARASDVDPAKAGKPAPAPASTPAAALGEWIDMHEGMPNAEAGSYEWLLKANGRAERPGHTSLLALFVPSEFPYYQYRLLPQESA